MKNPFRRAQQEQAESLDTESAIRQPWRPFWITFDIKLADMLSAIGLVESAEHWKSILANRQPQPDPEKDLEGYPYLRCTTIVRESTQNTAVVFWDPWKGHGIDYRVKFPIRSLSFSDSSLNPSFIIEDSGDCWSFGLQVDERWWEKAKAEHPEIQSAICREEGTEHRTRVYLVMGLLPLEYICQLYLDDCLTPVDLQSHEKEKLSSQPTELNWQIGNDRWKQLVHRHMEISHGHLR